MRFTSTNETIAINGHRFTVRMMHDCDSGKPWEESDGHGPIDKRRAYRNHTGHISKRPGELVLMEGHVETYFYDYQEACKIALRDGWGFLPGPLVTKRNSGGRYHAWVGCSQGYGEILYNVGGYENVNDAVKAVYALHRATYPTANAYAAAAARANFERLKAWGEKWHWVGVMVTHEETGERESLWCMESDDEQGLITAANELLETLSDSVFGTVYFATYDNTTGEETVRPLGRDETQELRELVAQWVGRLGFEPSFSEPGAVIPAGCGQYSAELRYTRASNSACFETLDFFLKGAE